MFNILPRRTYVYNYNFIKNNSEAIFYNTAFLLSPNNSSILLPFSKFASLRKNFFFFNGNGIATAWSFDSIEADSPLFVPLVETYDDDFFLPLTKDSSDSIDALVVEEKFNFDDLFVFITLAAFRHLLNFYQLISFLIFFKA